MQSNMQGGNFLTDIFKRSSGFEKSVEDTKKSENELLNSYEEMDKKIVKYHESYDKHIQNLTKLDEYIHFNGMENVFKTLIMKDVIKKGKIDKSDPILFKNYMIEGEVTPSEFRIEHLKSQVKFYLNKYFSNREHMFINLIVISDISKTSFNLDLITIDQKKYSFKISHDDFLVNKNDTKNALREVLLITKKNLKSETSLMEFDDSSRSGLSGSRSRFGHNNKSVRSSIKKSKKSVSTKSKKSKQNEGQDKLKSKTHVKSTKSATLSDILKSFKKTEKKQLSEYRTISSKQKSKNLKMIKQKQINNAEYAKLHPPPPPDECNVKTTYPECVENTNCFFKDNKCFKKQQQQAMQPTLPPMLANTIKQSSELAIPLV